jgi:isopropylmalate/homocitrate/citramalate synthase
MYLNSSNPYWHLPTCNTLPEFQAMMTLPECVELCDLTLDENGEGMAGVYMTEAEKVSLAKLLDEIGIQRIGVLGYPSPIRKQEVLAAKEITQLGLKAKCQTLVSSKEDIDCALEAGVWGIIIRKPCSDFYNVIVEPVEKKVEDFIQLATYAREQGAQVGMMAQDITRADLGATEMLICSIQDQFKLDELCVTDSQGLGNPFAFYFLVKRIKTWIDVPIAVHCHNHLGLGVANACAAVAAGAQIVHTTVNGLGHFAGMPPTEEVAVAIAIGYGVSVGIQYERLYELSKMVENYTGVKMHPHKPVTGEMMFSRSEEEKHIQELIDSTRIGVLKDYFPYMPNFVGNKPRVVMGQKVTRLAVEFNLAELGLKASSPQVDEIHMRVKCLAHDERRNVGIEELGEIAISIL